MSIKQNGIYRLGDHILACGDCTNQAFVKKVVQRKKITSIISDPPYGVSYVETKLNPGQNHKKIINDDLKFEEYTHFTQSWLTAIKKHLSEKNSFHIFNSDKMLFTLHTGIKQAGFKFSQLLIWVKSQAVIGRLDYLPQHELIAYGWFGKHKFCKPKDKSIIFCPKPHKNKHHPTIKPISLIRRLLLNSTDIKDTIYDGFLGSGTTLLAAEQTKRSCIGIEIDPEYCQLTLNRWQQLTGKKASKLGEIK